jgi:signal peptidase I
VAEQSGRRARRVTFWVLFMLALAGLAAGLGLGLRHGFAALNVFHRGVVAEGKAMENTIKPGYRLVLTSPAGLRRGDIVIERVSSARGSSGDIVTRVIALPGDHVSCCNANGQVVVNGRALHEAYLYPGNVPSTVKFSVTVPAGKYWLMGDHRSVADDSRERGPAPQGAIVSRVAGYFHGIAFTTLHTPRVFVAAGLAPKDTRYLVSGRWLEVAGGCAAALLLLIIFGSVRSGLRRRERDDEEPPEPTERPGQPDDAVPAPQ